MSHTKSNPLLQRAMDRFVGDEISDAGFGLYTPLGHFSRTRPGITDHFQLVYVASGLGYRIQPNAGVRHEQVETLFHQTSGFERKYQSGTSTMGLPLGALIGADSRACEFVLESEAAIPTVGAQVMRAFCELALPYFEKWSSLKLIDAELNDNPTMRSRHRALAWFRCSTGLIVAKLVGRSDYHELFAIYREIMEKDNRGFYSKRFQDLAESLNTIPPDEARIAKS